MPGYDYDIGVIGGGAAGLTVCAGAARLGAKVLLIEKEPALGGDCLHYGCVPSKTLIKSASAYHQIKNSRRFGLPEADIGPVDFGALKKHIQGVIDTIQRHDSVERFCGLGVNVRFGHPRFSDPHTVRLDGAPVTAKFWVIATGSRAAIPPLPGLDSVSFLTNREIFSLDTLPRTLAILGGGPIAVEMAQAFCRLGSTVHLIQRSGRILKKEDPDISGEIQAALAAEGVVFHLEATVEGIQQRHGKKEIVVADAIGGQTTIRADEVLVALGRTPNTENLGLRHIGVDFSSHGITVDRRLRTSHRHIFAPGDINGSFMFTHAAGYEGGIVVANAVFHLPRKTDYTLMPWCVYTHPQLAGIGMNESAATAAGIDYAVWTESFADNDRALTEQEAAGRIKMILDHRERPIGVQIIGPHAGDLLGEWVAALSGRIRLSTLAGAVHPYPTFAEINKRVAGTFFSSKIFSDRVKKGLKLFFNLKGTGENPCTRLDRP